MCFLRHEDRSTRFGQRRERFEREEERYRDDSSAPDLFGPTGDGYSSLRVVDGLDGIKLMVLDNVCYNIYEKKTFLFSEDKSYLNKKRIPDSASFEGIVSRRLSVEGVELCGDPGEASDEVPLGGRKGSVHYDVPFQPQYRPLHRGVQLRVPLPPQQGLLPNHSVHLLPSVSA